MPAPICRGCRRTLAWISIRSVGAGGLSRLSYKAANARDQLRDIERGGWSDEDRVIAGDRAEDIRAVEAVDDLGNPLRAPWKRLHDDKRLVGPNRFHLVAEQSGKPWFIAFGAKNVAHSISGVNPRDRQFLDIAGERGLR